MEQSLQPLSSTRRKRLNPYSNGMAIELSLTLTVKESGSLNPYFNGMKTEWFVEHCLKILLGVLILILMEWRSNFKIFKVWIRKFFCLNPYSNGMKIERTSTSLKSSKKLVLILILMEWRSNMPSVTTAYSSYCLNPYSNGMKIELQRTRHRYIAPSCLNPYSNGMKIEQR